MPDLGCRAWNKTTKKMIDLYKITHLAVSVDQKGIFIPDDENLIIMRATGREGKNYARIFESDIVKGKFPYAETGVVVWDDKRCGFFIKPIDGLGKAAYDKYYKMNSCKLERIGNIYENPELINPKQ